MKRGNASGGQIPREGMPVRIRNRRGIITSVDEYDSNEMGKYRLVHVEYLDSEVPPGDSVIWRLEHTACLIEPTALPLVHTDPRMSGDEFDALVRGARWSALNPFLKPENMNELQEDITASPFFGALQIEDFQLVPLLKAMRMPRVSLLLADDVGLGKTIEAGLILKELLLRRRLRRVLILCPASLRNQWRQEMKEKFSIDFDPVDRKETHNLQKNFGLEANPWRAFSKIIASYHYIKQPDILEQFLSTCRLTDDSSPVPASLPWDMLIVDEAHNLTPAAYGEDSDLAKMLRAISPYFEHKLFLTATPHNGHTPSFSGLLALLDPVRFVQTHEFKEGEKQRISEILVRRLKTDINEIDDELKRQRRFAQRFTEPLPLFFGASEMKLSRSVQELRKKIRTLFYAQSTCSADKNAKLERLAGIFAVEVLAKRLLSCPYTFAESWMRLKMGLEETDQAEAKEVTAAKRSSEADSSDDSEMENRTHHAVRIIGSWLKPFQQELAGEITAVDDSLSELGIKFRDGEILPPKHDSRFERLIELIDKKLRYENEWNESERLIIFTEYKTTLDYLNDRLTQHYEDDGSAVRILFGNMEQEERDEIKDAFNDPDDPVKILIATDAAAEGLNLQQTAHLLVQYDIPWNPARLEQRNGRLDRHGQARNVIVHHFTSDDDIDLKFLAHVMQKVETIEGDLGAMGEVFDNAFRRRFQDLRDAGRVMKELDDDVESNRNRVEIPSEKLKTVGLQVRKEIMQLSENIDLSPDSLKSTLETALSIDNTREPLEGPDENNTYTFTHPLPYLWEPVIDENMRKKTKNQSGALMKMVFDPGSFVRKVNGRKVFRPLKDTALVHLGHPMFRHAGSLLARARFPDWHEKFHASRWTVRYGKVPEHSEAIILMTVEEMAVNKLREPLHHWIRTLRCAFSEGKLEGPLPYVPPAQDNASPAIPDENSTSEARSIYLEIEMDLRDIIAEHAEKLNSVILANISNMKERALTREKNRFDARINETSKAMKTKKLGALTEQLQKQRDELNSLLFDDLKKEKRQEIRNTEEELARIRGRYQELLDRLKLEKERILTKTIPLRYQLNGPVRVFPVSVEMRLPEERQ